MADIELVIKIPEEIYQHYKKVWQKRRGSIPESCIAFGTPLSKGHGDLIDKNEIIKRYEKDCGRRIYVDNFVHDIELNIPTIIEADKGE